MEAVMSKIKLVVELDYPAHLFHEEDGESKRWFFEDILGRDELILYSNEIGDDIGTIKVLETTPTPKQEDNK
jgi:hypothetical protein